VIGSNPIANLEQHFGIDSSNVWRQKMAYTGHV